MISISDWKGQFLRKFLILGRKFYHDVNIVFLNLALHNLMFTETYQWKVNKQSVCWKPWNFLKLTRVSSHRAPFLQPECPVHLLLFQIHHFHHICIHDIFVWELNASTFATICSAWWPHFHWSLAGFCVFGLIWNITLGDKCCFLPVFYNKPKGHHVHYNLDSC